MKYKIILQCNNIKDAEKYDRKLEMNNYDAATATFKVLVKGALEDIIDSYIIEFYYGEILRFKFESLKI